MSLATSGCVRLRLLLAAALVAGLAPLVWAVQRDIKAKCHTFKNAPVQATNPRVRLVEIFATSTSLSDPTSQQVHGTRVRYMNRANQLPSAFVLSGEVTCVNRSPKLIQAIKLTVVPMNAFHEAMRSSTTDTTGNQVMLSLSPGSSRVVSWEQRAPSSDVYQVAVVVTAVTFANDEVWRAPDEELIADD